MILQHTLLIHTRTKRAERLTLPVREREKSHAVKEKHAPRLNIHAMTECTREVKRESTRKARARRVDIRDSRCCVPMCGMGGSGDKRVPSTVERSPLDWCAKPRLVCFLSVCRLTVLATLDADYTSGARRNVSGS